VLWLVRSDGSSIEVGRYDPAIVHHALVYAADGRVTTVTMVTAEPLHDLRILLHPALVDTGLGCSAIRLDQLADQVSTGWNAPNQSLVRRREAAIANLYYQDSVYRWAWAIRMQVLSDRYRRHFDQLEDYGRWALARAEEITDLGNALSTELPLADLGFLSSNPEFYDRRLVNILSRCDSSESVNGFDGCIRRSLTPEVPATESYGSDSTMSWAAAPPGIVSWSGVREQPWVVDEAISFMKSDQPLGPFRFMVQIAFTSPPSFVSDVAGYDPMLESFDDETPHEITSLANPLMDEIVSNARQEAETAEVLTRMAEFTHLQRLFRAVLDGQLVLTDMVVDDLATLASQTAGFVNRAQTLRWLPQQQPEASDLGDEIARLRESLGLDVQMALADSLRRSGCPTPAN